MLVNYTLTNSLVTTFSFCHCGTAKPGLKTRVWRSAPTQWKAAIVLPEKLWYL